MLFRRTGYWLRNEHGAAMVEMALSIPILMTITFGMIETSLMFYTHAAISELAREGSRYAMMHGPNCLTAPSATSCTVSATGVQTYISGIAMPNLGGGTMTPTVNFPNGQVDGKTVVVTVTYTFPYKIPFVTHSNLSMQSVSTETIIQ